MKQLQRLLFLFPLLLISQTALASGWNDYSLTIAPGYEIARCNTLMSGLLMETVPLSTYLNPATNLGRSVGTLSRRLTFSYARQVKKRGTNLQGTPTFMPTHQSNISLSLTDPTTNCLAR